jgi:sugar diacid utilization regulator
VGGQRRHGDVDVPEADEPARAVAARIAARKETLAREIVDRFQRELVGSRIAVEEDSAPDEALAFALRNVEVLLDGLAGGDAVTPELLDEAHEFGRRSVRRGTSLDSLLREGRIWGAALWESVVTATLDARGDDERAAALELGSRIWRHVDLVSSAAAHAYLDEITDRGLIGRELLNALLAGHGDAEETRRLARSRHLRLGTSYVVVLFRVDGTTTEEAPQWKLATRAAVDRLVAAARNGLQPAAGSLLAGIRRGDLVVLHPISEPTEMAGVRRACDALARELEIDVSVGISGWHEGLAGLPVAYAEAWEAVEIAAGTGIRGQAIALEDVLIDHMLRSSPHARRILEATLRPLIEYDQAHRAALVPTLRVYFDEDTNLTRSARALMVHSNTVLYRLRRIRELSGRDPRDLRELMILYLGLKLFDLRALESEG